MSFRARLRIVLLLLSGFAVLLATSAAASPTAPTDAPPTWLFDFGCATSPVADGYTQVTNTTLYDAAKGYGLDRTTNCRDRGAPDDLRRDFTVGNYGFAVDVPNGNYRVVVISGDQIASNTTTVSVEGQPAQTITATTASFPSLGMSVAVADGQLNFVFGRDGRVNAIAIAQISPPTGLSVGAERLWPTQSVALTWNAVPGVSGYNVYRKRSDDSDFQRIATTTDPGYTDQAVELGLEYDYAISALGAGIVESETTAPLPVKVFDSSVTPPAAPTGLTVQKSVQHDTFTLQWGNVKGARLYYVYRASGTTGDFVRIDTTQTSEYTLFIAPSTPCCYDFRYQVTAVNEGGLSSPSDAVRLTLSTG